MKKTFTLIELLVYLSIFSFILLFFFGFFWERIFSEIRGNIFQDIQEEGYFVILKIEKEIKKAKSIIFPLPGTSGNYLSLEMADPNLNPTIFELENGKLKITQSSNSYFLTSDSVKIENLSFLNLSFSGTPGIIKVEVEISSSNILYKNSFIFKSSCSLLPQK